MTHPGRLVLVGHPVSHSLSPRFQNAALRAAGIPLTYEAIDVAPETLAASMSGLVAMRAAGNVTIPHKEAVFALCASRTPLAERVGAVNTFWVEDGRLAGDNTDVGGFDAAIRDAFGAVPENLRVAVLGAGGGAAGVLAAIERWPGASAAVASRSRERAALLVRRFANIATVADSNESAAQGSGLVVNATPVGLHDHMMPLDPATLAPHTLVFDLAYRPGLTPWVLRARRGGLRAADGIGMLIEQGALSFARWFGIPPDRNAMWAAVSARDH